MIVSRPVRCAECGSWHGTASLARVCSAADRGLRAIKAAHAPLLNPAPRGSTIADSDGTDGA